MHAPSADSAAKLTETQKSLYTDMKKGIASNFNLFLTVAPEGSADAGALLDRGIPGCTKPRIGAAIWELTKAMTAEASLPDPVRQIAILVTGAHFGSAYELYAHIAVAEEEGMSKHRLATLVSGSRPDDLMDRKASPTTSLSPW